MYNFLEKKFTIVHDCYFSKIDHEAKYREEALAIAIYCALKYRTDFTTALVTAVNHDGDSDSTGAITGNILGAYLGLNQIPPRWIQQVELSNVLSQVADDLFVGNRDDNDWWERYPGY